MNDELFGELHEQEENGLYGRRHLNELNGNTVKLVKGCPDCKGQAFSNTAICSSCGAVIKKRQPE